MVDEPRPEATPSEGSPEGPILVVLNPNASRIREPARRAELTGHLARVTRERFGCDPEFIVPAGPDELESRLAARIGESPRMVVAVGGDGTITTAATALAGSQVPLAIVPAGTGNLLAGTLHIPGRARAAIEALPNLIPRQIDLGQTVVDLVDGSRVQRAFAVAAGSGFEALVMQETPQRRKRLLGRVAYFATAFRLSLSVRRAEFTVTVDGQRFETKASMVLVANCAELIPGWISPRREIIPNDGLLDVLVLRGGGFAGMVLGGLELLLRESEGPSQSGRSMRLAGSRITIESRPPQPIQVDGDVIGAGRLEITIRPLALTVLVPARSVP